MIQVIIDTSDVSRELSLSKEQTEGLIDYCVKECTAAFAAKWAETASRVLKGTRQEYVRSIYLGDNGKFTGFVTLRGFLPNAIEQGMAAYDMKPGMLNSSKAHIKLGGGKYITIPFRWATAGSIGESQVFSGVMPQVVSNIVTSKKANPVTGATQPLKESELPSLLQIPTTRAKIILKSKTFEEYKRKTSIFTGISKAASGSGYKSFRRVSDKSDANSWIFPGLTARNFSSKALADLDLRQIIDYSSEQYFSKIL